jgi:hypothetical protein
LTALGWSSEGLESSCWHPSPPESPEPSRASEVGITAPSNMRRFTAICCIAALATAPQLASSSPAPLPAPLPAPTAAVAELPGPEPRAPLITPSPVADEPTRTVGVRRDLLSDIGNGINTVLSELGSDLPSWFASGVPQFFQDLPTGTAVQSSLGLSDEDMAAIPTQVLNINPYANWTDAGWNVRFHGNVYKQPDISTESLDDLANVFLIGTDIEDLPPDQQDQARNMTASIFVVQQSDVNVSTISLEPGTAGSSGDETGGGGAPAPGGRQEVTLPYPTTPQGDFDVFLPIRSNELRAGNETEEIQKLNTYVEGTSIGNSTAYLVPPTGITIISDVDDILRVTKIYDPTEGLLNSFARPFVAWQNMPEIFDHWSDTIPNLHFHYLTTTPEQVTRNYMQFIHATYPGGSFDTRPLNFSDVSATLAIRQYLLDMIFDTFPERKFVLVADTSNSDIMK